MAEFSFDATTVAPQQEFDILPAGKYVAQVIDSEIVPTKSGTGTMLKLTLEVLEGQHANRKVWSRLNIANDNPDAERIGRAQLSALCHAVGVTKLSDSLELHDKPVLITVKVRHPKPGDTYGPSNDVSGFAPVSSASPTTLAKPAARPAAPAASTPPWAKSAA